MARARRGIRAIFEVTERALANKPAELLRRVEAIRADGWGIALDDVGADWRSLALMPFIRPDVIKLDMHLIQAPMDESGAKVAEAVRAYAASSGAHILAEGIETEAHLRRALALGATFGQGWMFGQPGLLTATHPRTLVNDPQFIKANQPAGDRTPMELVRDLVPTNVASKGDLLVISRSLEERALQVPEPCVVLSTFQNANYFTAGTARFYAQLATRASFVGAFGHGMSTVPASGVRGARLPDNDRLLGEWDVFVISPYYAGALVSEEIGDLGRNSDRRFRFAVISDRDLVLRAARTLMLRMTSLPS
jgi:hypothetical protein